MITKNSINLKITEAKCFAMIGRPADGACNILSAIHEKCGNYRCPFFKPEGCKDWIRSGGRRGTVLVPPEEYYRK